MTLLAPAALAGFALFVPVVLLYMLRLRRREVFVSSTFLWQQVVRDREANTPWQRLRRNLLLLLQLLIIALIVLALARPALIVPAVSSGRTALLLDASASMNAADGAPGTRFETAIRRARDILATAGESDEFSVIRVGTTAEVLVPFTADRSALQAALAAATPGQGGADWNTAFTLAAAGAQGTEAYTTVILSDGGSALSAASGPGLPALPGAVRYEPVGTRADNLAVTALATRALPGGSPQLFAQVVNYGASDAEAIFDLRVDGELFAAERITVPAGASLPFVSAALPQGFVTVRAGLTAPAEADWPDALALDDAGYTVAEASGARRVLLVSAGNVFLEQALRSLPGVAAFAVRPGSGLPDSSFDLIVLDGVVPDSLPRGDVLFINPDRSTALFSVGETREATTDPATSPTGNIRLASADPRLRYLDLSSVNLLRFREVTADWAEPLIVANGGPLLLAGDTGAQRAAILTFDVRDSDLPLQIAFPLLMAGLLDWFAPQSLVNAPASHAVGAAVTLDPQPGANAVRVTPPGGEAVTLPLDANGEAIFSATDSPGLYLVEALTGEAITQSAVFAVNLFDPAESAIAPQAAIRVGGESVLPEQGEALGQRELWPALALAALALLLLEWLIYFRRQRAPSRFKPVAAPGPVVRA